MTADSNIYLLIQYAWLIPPILFLFGTIKLNKNTVSTGKRLLLIGFGLLTVYSVVTLAQYLHLFVIYYNPSYEIAGSGTIWFNSYDGIDIDKWLYWGIFATRNLGYTVAAFGFFIECRSRHYSLQQDIYPTTLES